MHGSFPFYVQICELFVNVNVFCNIILQGRSEVALAIPKLPPYKYNKYYLK